MFFVQPYERKRILSHTNEFSQLGGYYYSGVRRRDRHPRICKSKNPSVGLHLIRPDRRDNSIGNPLDSARQLFYLDHISSADFNLLPVEHISIGI